MATYIQQKISDLPPEVTKWIDLTLVPVYAIGALVVFGAVRYVDTKYIRPASKTGYGKGAPGFMTNTRKLKVTPEIAARLRAGEQVSPEEIDAAVRAAEDAKAKAEKEEEDEEVKKKAKKSSGAKKTKKNAPTKLAHQPEPPKVASEPGNEWIPESHLQSSSQKPRRRQK